MSNLPSVDQLSPEIKPSKEPLQDSLEIRDNTETKFLMLEDETIPSYMNIASISSLTKRDDWRIEIDEQTQSQLVAGESSGEKTSKNHTPLYSAVLALLKAQLNQKVAECEGLKLDYKMVVNKNCELKKELDELKEAFAKYRQEHEPEAAKVQTEEIPSVFDKTTVSYLKSSENKLSASSSTSAQSASLHWTDSNCPLLQASSRILQPVPQFVTQSLSDLANTELRRNYQGQSKSSLSSPVTSTHGFRKHYASDSHDVGDTLTFNPNESSRDSAILKNDGIKCFVYKEYEHGKEMSFFLQAEGADKVESSGVVGERGPFLLDNFEIRMSEANDTTNVWEKEISHESIFDSEEDAPEGNDLRPKTPNDRFRVNGSAYSTNQKVKASIRQLPVKSKIFRQLRATSNRHTGKTDDPIEMLHGSMPNLDDPGLQARLGCSSEQSIYSPAHCDTVQHRYGVDHGTDYHIVSGSSSENLYGKHKYNNFAHTEENRRHRTSSNSLSGNSEDNYSHLRRRCHSVEIPYDVNIESTCPRGRIHSADEQSPHMRGTTHLTSEKCSEATDNSRRRHSHKGLRGILKDVFKSCGDCRHPQTTSFETRRLQQLSANSLPEILVTPPVREANEQNPS